MIALCLVRQYIANCARGDSSSIKAHKCNFKIYIIIINANTTITTTTTTTYFIIIIIKILSFKDWVQFTLESDIGHI